MRAKRFISYLRSIGKTRAVRIAEIVFFVVLGLVCGFVVPMIIFGASKELVLRAFAISVSISAGFAAVGIAIDILCKP